MVIARTMEAAISRASASFPVLLVTGARQVGKTTLVQHCATPDRTYVTLDDPLEAELAQRDPSLFFQRHQPPVIVDEVQYAPDLLRTIKMLVDQSGKAGQFWLTGSQKFRLMAGVTESLAGRVAVFDLFGLSQAEIGGRPATAPFVPSRQWLTDARRRQPAPFLLDDVFRRIWRGSFPRPVLDAEVDHNVFYSSYTQTYIQRDVRHLHNVGNERDFLRFVQAAAARTGQLLNLSDLARDVDISQKTAKSWLSILEASGVVYLLQPYHTNVTKRLLKRPKLYFLDTGLASYLTRWSSPETTAAGAMAGPLFETWVVGEILKSWWHNGQTPPVWFYRDRDGREIDLLVEIDQQLHPVEIKKSASPRPSDAKHFDALAHLGVERGQGAVVCLRPDDIPLAPTIDAIPVGYL